MADFTFNEPKDPAPQQVVRFEDIQGTIQQVDSAPTWTPRGRLTDTLAISNGVLYFFDRTLGWTALGATVFAGRVNIDGTPNTPFPAGWTSAVDGSGNFTITHNLGTTNYVVTVITEQAYCGADLRGGYLANSFGVTTFDGSNLQGAHAFSFILVKTS